MAQNQEDVDAFLAHYGVKGMRWGVRKERDSSGGNSQPNRVFNKRNAAIAGGVVAIGAGVTLAILAKDGRLATTAIRSNPQVREAVKGGAKFIAKNARSTAKPAASAASAAASAKSRSTADSIRQTQRMFEKIQWDATVKDLDNLISSAHAEQTLAMRKAMAAYGGTYNPRDNQYSPEAKRLQIGR